MYCIVCNNILSSNLKRVLKSKDINEKRNKR